MKYMIPKEAAEKWGISVRRVQLLCTQGKIAGAERHGRMWLIPENAEKPYDARVKSGRYIKNNPGVIKALDIANLAVPKPRHQSEKYTRFLPDVSHVTIPRPRLTEKIAPLGSNLTFIHADAGYGKTTLLAQYADERDDVIWLSLDERDGDLISLLRHLEDAFRRRLPRFNFYVTDLLPFTAENTFTQRALSAFLGAIGHRKLTLILDDVHIITGGVVMDFFIGLVKSCPPHLTLVMAGRHELWSGLYRLKMDGRITEITKADLRFNREEAKLIWGFFDEEAYTATEGWALALQSYRMAAENGKLPAPRNDRKLYRYLMEEIFNHLPETLKHFLMSTAWLGELDPTECDRLLGIHNSQEILDELVRRNLFTTQVSSGTYRYHSLFADFLRQNGTLGREVLRKVMLDCFARGQYEQAADCALLLEDVSFVHECVSAALGRPFGQGRYGNLKGYFALMEARKIELSPRVLLARGLYLSSQGLFYEADQCLKEALPKLEGDRRILVQVMAHKARILRSKVSFAESNSLLDSLLPLPEDTPMEDVYLVMIEKIHNLTLSTRLTEALELTQSLIEQCTVRGNTRVRAWFERYLTVVYFYKGDYLKCLKYYEKSLSLTDVEQDWLSRHCVGPYAAKAYQVNGQGEKALPLMEAELSRLRRLGLHEELSLNYLVYAEILLAKEVRKVGQGGFADFSGLRRYLELAEEHAALNRSAGDHLLFARILRMGAELLERPDKALYEVKDILRLAKDATPFAQALAYARVANALCLMGQDLEESKACYQIAIEIGEKYGILNLPAICYGELAAVFLREGEEEKAEEYAQRFLELSKQYGHRCNFWLRTMLGEVLKFALKRGIDPTFAREMLEYGSYTAKRVYINTLGSFYIAPAHDRLSRVKIRTQKSRELLAYLLEHREGVGRDRIIADLWEDNEGDVIGMFHTRRGDIRRAFENLGAQNPIVHERGIYRLDTQEIICDHDAFRLAAEDFRKDPSTENAQRVVDHYTGRYLDDMEALWAESARLRCEDIFLQAAESLLESYRETGERAKTVELLRRCTALSYQGHRFDGVKDGKRRRYK